MQRRRCTDIDPIDKTGGTTLPTHVPLHFPNPNHATRKSTNATSKPPHSNTHHLHLVGIPISAAHLGNEHEPLPYHEGAEDDHGEVEALEEELALVRPELLELEDLLVYHLPEHCFYYCRKVYGRGGQGAAMQQRQSGRSNSQMDVEVGFGGAAARSSRGRRLCYPLKLVTCSTHFSVKLKLFSSRSKGVCPSHRSKSRSSRRPRVCVVGRISVVSDT